MWLLKFSPHLLQTNSSLTVIFMFISPHEDGLLPDKENINVDIIYFKESVPRAAGTGFGRMGMDIFSLVLEEGGTTAVGFEADWRMLAMPETDIEVRLRMGLSGEGSDLTAEAGASNVGNTDGNIVGFVSRLISGLT